MVALASEELLKATGLVKSPHLLGIAAVTAVNVVWWCYFGMIYAWALGVLLVFTVFCFVQMLCTKGQLPFAQVAMTMIAGLLIPFLLSALVRIRIMENGVFFIAAPFVMAFMPDTGAYLIGCAFGKHKLCPAISPKKTVEGLFGGFLGGIVGMVVYGLVLQNLFGFTVNYLFAVIYGVLGAGFATFGDLMFSVIKRQSGIKDYGKLLPGHGGILDRFDSVTIVAPLAEALLLILPLAVK
jgi:phosphatidate cytidylyltransferase